MTIKVLLLNIPFNFTNISENIEVTKKTIADGITIHDYHVVICNTSQFIKSQVYENMTERKQKRARKNYGTLSKKMDEQTKTGGWIFCFSGPKVSSDPFAKISTPASIGAYNWCPVDISVRNERGDTFYPVIGDVRYYAPLLNEIPSKSISWVCCFDEYPNNSKIIVKNRAGYAIFLEVPNGNGKFVFLPRFKNMRKATEIIIKQIIPNIFQEDDIIQTPTWLLNYHIPLEKKIQQRLSEIRTAKRVLYTKNRPLEKSSMLILNKLGFNVEILPRGTKPDLRIISSDKNSIIEIKGHDNRATNRRDVLQLLGYLSETDTSEKGIVISNHEFLKPPNERTEKAFTDGAIQLAVRNDISLISSVDLWKLYLRSLEAQLTENDIKAIHQKIMTEFGILSFSEFY